MVECRACTCNFKDAVHDQINSHAPQMHLYAPARLGLNLSVLSQKNPSGAELSLFSYAVFHLTDLSNGSSFKI